MPNCVSFSFFFYFITDFKAVFEASGKLLRLGDLKKGNGLPKSQCEKAAWMRSELQQFEAILNSSPLDYKLYCSQLGRTATPPPPHPLGKHRHLEGEEKWQTQQSAFVIQMLKISLNSCPEEGDTREQE